MKIVYFTKEYPPNVYGGAGVHIKNLTRQLSKKINVEVRCIGNQAENGQNLKVKGYQAWSRMWEGNNPLFNSALGTFSCNLSMIRDPIDGDLVHSHTWYGALAGYMAKILYKVPYIATVHSLEPLRPWKEEQLGRSYHLTAWVEKLALENADCIIAVSEHSKSEILQYFDIRTDKVTVIYNGVDLEKWQPIQSESTRKAFNIEGDYILFVGRTSRQKGLIHLLDAMDEVDNNITLVCCTSAPDTPEIEQEIKKKVAEKQNILWINSLLRESQYIELYSNASVFVCPSIYEPFGIINLEAMACQTPVVASAVGGIQEVVVPEETGLLVPPGDPKLLAAAVNKVLGNKNMARQMGIAGRSRVEKIFSWEKIAEKTRQKYKKIIETGITTP